MTDQASPDLLDLAESVANGELRMDEAERQVRGAPEPQHAAADTAVRELRGLIAAASAVRAHAHATREAFGAASGLAPVDGQGPAPISTLIPGPVTAGGVHRRSPNGRVGVGRAPRRTWLLVAATIAIGAGVVGASVVGGRLVTPDPAPTTPVAIVSATAVPSAGPSAAVVQPTSGLIAFMTRTGAVGPQLWYANADGTGKHELAPGGCQGLPSWSPDGTRLLFSRNQCAFMTDLGDAGTRLYLTDASGSTPQLVDTGCVAPCVSDSHGVFSSDGRRILFSRLNVVDAPPEATPGLLGKSAPPMQSRVLATMDLDTGRVTELGDAQDASSFPDWSPDRTQVVFTGCPMPRAGCPFDPELPPTSASENPGSEQVFVADADGRNVRRLTPSGWSGSSGAAFNDGTRAILSGAWSSDGTRILFRGIQHVSAGNEIRLLSDIYMIRPDGTDLRRLTTDGISSDPAWSVDGRIWFLRTAGVGGNQADGPAQHWVMDADGANATQSSLGPQPQDLADTARQPTP